MMTGVRRAGDGHEAVQPSSRVVARLAREDGWSCPMVLRLVGVAVACLALTSGCRDGDNAAPIFVEVASTKVSFVVPSGYSSVLDYGPGASLEARGVGFRRESTDAIAATLTLLGPGVDSGYELNGAGGLELLDQLKRQYELRGATIVEQERTQQDDRTVVKFVAHTLTGGYIQRAWVAFVPSGPTAVLAMDAENEDNRPAFDAVLESLEWNQE